MKSAQLAPIVAVFLLPGSTEASGDAGARGAMAASYFLQYHRDALAIILPLLVLQTVLMVLMSIGRRNRTKLVKELRLLSGRLITAQEDERKRIARELHDDVTQRLALHSIELDQWNLASASPEDQAHLRSLSTSAAEISIEVHNIAHRLHPSKLKHLGLLPAVRELGKEIAIRHGIDIDIEDENVPEDLPGDTTLCLYRVAQEALNNVLRHSGASHATISLSGRRGLVAMRIMDNGHGFDPLSIPTTHGIGLFSMRERLHLVRGQMNICSRPGNGTEVQVTVPVRAAAGD